MLHGISLTQPWCSLMAIGAKRYETRSWQTPFRGLLAICAAKKFPEECKRLAYKNDPFSAVLHAGGFTTIQKLIDATGHVLCVVELVACVRTEGGRVPFVTDDPSYFVEPGEHEQSFGDYGTGRFAWITRHLIRLATPVPVKGALGVFRLPEDVEAEVRKQLP